MPLSRNKYCFRFFSVLKPYQNNNIAIKSPLTAIWSLENWQLLALVAYLAKEFPNGYQASRLCYIKMFGFLNSCFRKLPCLLLFYNCRIHNLEPDLTPPSYLNPLSQARDHPSAKSCYTTSRIQHSCNLGRS